MISFNEFLKQTKKVKEHRIHKVKNSYGVNDAFKYYRKIRDKSSEYVLTESQYYYIIRNVNKLLRDNLINGDDVNLPNRMGRLEIRKYEPTISIKDEKVRANLPINWNATLKLWYEDEESHKNKTLVKVEEREIYKIYYNRNVANFNNKSFYTFNVNRELKNKLKQAIKNDEIDAFKLDKTIINR